eukprot:CAMPEP_0117682380 /NCGR_PEP_ID=MMETSP0804-20121206/19619_1 /TAXON_ID=1074897 /ORGANISM="Tetraselmis astigmatica, Strain CCMP880" /LENGTH=84 /DNA_ID=CAMNT_0005492469 /DNA_START=136 /DNA_END=390 /DNA_ORIENTATION=-
MRKGLHPLLKPMTVVLTNGASIELMTVSTRTKVYKLTKDVLNHPTWNPEVGQVDLSAGQVSKFMRKFDISEEEAIGDPGFGKKR